MSLPRFFLNHLENWRPIQVELLPLGIHVHWAMIYLNFYNSRKSFLLRENSLTDCLRFTPDQQPFLNSVR